MAYLPLQAFALNSALILLAIAKAGLVLMYFMHLRDETKTLQLWVLLPFVLPILYAAVLGYDSFWRPSP